LGGTTDQPAADQTLNVYASVDPVNFLETSKHFSDYYVHCNCSCAQQFIIWRDFNPEEYKNQFEGTIPTLAYLPAIPAQISEGIAPAKRISVTGSLQ
jgi:hypothetical protein